jgi:hypothetical protein
MSRAAKIFIALIMAFTASASHAKVVVAISGAGDAAMEFALDGARDRAADAIIHRCASPAGSPANARSSCPFETATRTEPLSLSGRIGRPGFPDHMVPVYSGRIDNPDHGPPKPLS